MLTETMMSFMPDEESRIIEMAWEDRTPFEAILQQFGLKEPQVIALMKRSLRSNSYKLWRRRVNGRATKHLKMRNPEISRGYCPTQYKQR
jgi:uncharacterized protein (TIGR03643 family)|tara:strand:+ start:919 stop:1188 length:270 start_codon:yes stop_codon:yes gene_type:complete